jgi:alpha-acetolactate decarboxylase
MLKAVDKFEDLFILNLNLFIATLLDDFKGHVNMFIVLNGMISINRMQPLTLEMCNSSETT